jgi:hypothetical protein
MAEKADRSSDNIQYNKKSRLSSVFCNFLESNFKKYAQLFDGSRRRFPHRIRAGRLDFSHAA